MHVAVNAHLLSPVAGYRQAGVSQYIAQLLRHLWPAAPDARWTVYAPPGVTPDLIEATPAVTLHTSRLQTTDPIKRIAWEQMIAPATLRRDRPDVLLCPLNVVPLLAPCPTVVTVHDLAFLRFRLHRPAKRLYLATLTRQSVKRAAHIITVSAWTRHEVIDLLHVDPANVSAIPNGLNAEFQPLDPAAVAAFRAQKGLPPRFVLTIGTLEPRKNIANLIRAYAAAKDRLGMPLLIGGGKGWMYDEIFALVREFGLEDDVRFLGFVPQDELPALYAAAITFVYPSLYEGFGFPPLEAMAMGTPVVVSNTSSLPEVVGDAALLVPPQDVSALAAALIAATTDDRVRAELRAKGREQARRFTWQQSAQATVAVLRRVAHDAS